MSSKTASVMRWHHEDRINDGKLRHPADAEAWKEFDRKYPIFAQEPRNIRLALASDGFNPFRTMSISYSIWPVFLIPYNLPPWMVMKQPNFILSLIIPGPKGPGNKIDVYMQPLIKELKELWEVGIETFDASMNQNFQLKAALLWTISDFPAYANLSGWSTKGEYACPVCGFDTASQWLHNGRKYCYMCHRRWLPYDHEWRDETMSFDGKEELRGAPRSLSGEEVLEQLKDFDFLEENSNGGPWKKKSIFFMLPYWKDLVLRHNLDAMHLEKNVADNVTGTIMGQEGKSKDNYKARLDLQLMGLRSELHPRVDPHRVNVSLPKACYQMTRAEKDIFLQTLKAIKAPDEYSSNISRCVHLKERKLIGLKSHDCHILMQELLPIAIRGTLPNHVCSVLVELSDFFKRICSKVLSEIDLQYLEARIAVLLCKLEKIFPPSFFTIMVHLMIHLVKEVRLGGPVNFRWMYPIERDLPTETEDTKDWVISNMGMKWRSWKAELKSKFFDSSKTVDEVVEMLSDDRVDKQQFRALVNLWSKPEYQMMCEQKRVNRTKSDEPHCIGTKSFARFSHEEAKKNNGNRLSRAELYIRSRTRRNGRIVNSKAASVVDNLKDVMNSSDDQQSLMDKDWSQDIFSKVKGPERRGYIRCIGKIPKAKGNSTSSSSLQVPLLQAKIDQLEASLTNTHSVLSSLLGIMKEHVSNADLARVVSQLNMQISTDTNSTASH